MPATLRPSSTLLRRQAPRPLPPHPCWRKNRQAHCLTRTPWDSSLRAMTAGHPAPCPPVRPRRNRRCCQTAPAATACSASRLRRQVGRAVPASSSSQRVSSSMAATSVTTTSVSAARSRRVSPPAPLSEGPSPRPRQPALPPRHRWRRVSAQQTASRSRSTERCSCRSTRSTGRTIYVGSTTCCTSTPGWKSSSTRKSVPSTTLTPSRAPGLSCSRPGPRHHATRPRLPLLQAWRPGPRRPVRP